MNEHAGGLRRHDCASISEAGHVASLGEDLNVSQAGHYHQDSPLKAGLLFAPYLV